MSHVKREMERIESLGFQAIEVAKDAGALKECDFPGHSDCVTDQGDEDANRSAYAIGTNLWKKGEVDGTREEFMEAVKDAITMAPSGCPECERMRSRDD